MTEDIIFETEIEWAQPTGRTVPMRAGFYRPRNEGSRWACKFFLRADGFTESKEIYGEDSLQAFELALAILKTHLEILREKQGAKFSIWGQALEEMTHSILKP